MKSNPLEFSDKEIVDSYCGMYWLNHIYGQVDCRELKRLTYLEWLISTKENSEEILKNIDERIKKMKERYLWDIIKI
jgi:hypothetical protein